MNPLIAILALSAWAQSASLDRSLDELAATRQINEAAISPDGARVAWVEDQAIYVGEWKSAGFTPRGIGPGSAIAWSPDSSSLAFLSSGDAGPGGARQLYVVAAGGDAPRRVTNLKGYLASPAWSPDGLRIALLFAENASAGGGPLGAAPAQTGVIESEFHNQRIAVVDPASGAVRQVSPPGLHVYEFDWSPDGRSFAFIGAPGPGDNNWWIARLYTMGLDSSEPREVFQPAANQQLAVPRWSPDGTSIAFICGLMSDEGFNGGDVFTIPAGGGEARSRTLSRRSSPNWVAWLSPTRLLLTEACGGGSAIAALALDSGRVETLWKGDFDVHAGGHYASFSLAADGVTSALIRRSWREPPEIWAGPIAKWRRVTSLNAERRPRWGDARSVEWKNEGFDVQGWLIYPQPFDPARRYPMVVSVHGGPANLKKPSWPGRFFDLTLLSSEGYFVFFPNPRGSYGQGEAFVQANVKDFGGGDLRDILSGVDHVVKNFPVDGSRVGVAGWSYGGFMTMWAVTQTNRFRAAVAGAGIANWQSYYGENLIDRWMIPYFGASVYDDPAVYAKSSPISFIKRVKTPALVLVGERDAECPSPQSFEFWHALKTLGVDTQLVVYAGEGHDFRQPENRRDALRRTADWFNRLLK